MTVEQHGEPTDIRAAERVLVELLALEREIAELNYVRRSDALERADEGVRRLGELGSAEGILARAAAELGASGQFDRVLVSEVVGLRLRPLAVWAGADQTGADELLTQLREAPVQLAYPLIEAEIVSRRATEIVTVGGGRGRAPGPLAEVWGWRSYVVAALIAQGESIGLLHADAAASGRSMDALDLEVVTRYAEGLSGVFERAVLRHTLELHRAELRSAGQWIGGRLSRLSDATAFERPRAATAAEQRLVQSLTPRELDVLRLLARGGTNAAIAEALLVREGTVKYHVKNILRKLGATSRTDAVSRFVRSTSTEGRAVTSAVLSGPLGLELRRRLVNVTAEARALLELPAESSDDGGPAQLGELIAGVKGLLAAAPGAEAEQLAEEHEQALNRLRNRFDARFEALARAHAAVNALREITLPAAMLSRAPGALCQASKLQRAVLSLVSGGRMVAEAAHFSGDDARAARVVEALAANPIRLEHPLIETELMRRRRATIVVDAALHPRVDRRLCELMQWTSYAAAPLVVGGQVIGLLHADRGPEGRLDVLDRDVLWEFASALAQAYESASLVRTLRHEREQMRQFLDWLNARSSELTDAPIRLATVQRPPRPPLAPYDAPVAFGGRDDRVVFEGLLTRRELDVLRLLADGQANKSIADALVISDGTVKFHVNSILRKLHVANRAEAVSRYLRLLGMRAP